MNQSFSASRRRFALLLSQRNSYIYIYIYVYTCIFLHLFSSISFRSSRRTQCICIHFFSNLVRSPLLVHKSRRMEKTEGQIRRQEKDGETGEMRMAKGLYTRCAEEIVAARIAVCSAYRIIGSRGKCTSLYPHVLHPLFVPCIYIYIHILHYVLHCIVRSIPRHYRHFNKVYRYIWVHASIYYYIGCIYWGWWQIFVSSIDHQQPQKFTNFDYTLYPNMERQHDASHYPFPKIFHWTFGGFPISTQLNITYMCVHANNTRWIDELRGRGSERESERSAECSRP